MSQGWHFLVGNGCVATPILTLRTSPATSTPRHQRPYPQQLGLSAPEMTVLVGGLCGLGVSYKKSSHGVFTDTPGRSTNDFFVSLLDMGIEGEPISQEGVYEGKDAKTGKVRWAGTRNDLVFVRFELGTACACQ